MTSKAEGHFPCGARRTLLNTALIGIAGVLALGTTAPPAAGESAVKAYQQGDSLSTVPGPQYEAQYQAPAKVWVNPDAAVSNTPDEEAADPAPEPPEPKEEATAAEESDGYGDEFADSGDGEATADQSADAVASSAAYSKKGKKAKKSKNGSSAFKADPMYEEYYETEEQVNIYGGKMAVEPPRPPLEIGRQQYTSGIYDESSTPFGELNPLVPGLAVYGDWRTAIAYNQNNGKDIAQVATRLNLDVDLKITGTERIHAFFTPIQEDNVFTRYEFGAGDGLDDFDFQFDGDAQTLFFEGDAGSIYSGFSGTEATFDLPFTAGLFPLFLQNGIWANDAILGGAFTIPAQNSAMLGLANFDVTFFGAFDNVDNAALVGADGKVDNNSANLFGATAFIDAFDGYIETGYALVQGLDEQDDVLDHYLTAAYSRRYYNTLSNTTRVFANFRADGDEDSDGFAIISENSLISGLPSTLVPYANFFVGFGSPKPLVDGNGAGILKNVGINFETDALTGYPKLDDTGSNAFGGAIGLQYLFDLDQQLVFEVAFVEPFEDDGLGANDTQIGFGLRYQVPINRAWLFRADATYQITQGVEEDNFGVRAEIRRKF